MPGAAEVTCTGGTGLCTSISYDPANNNRISTIGSSAVTYDAAGNLTSDGTGTGSQTYQWDAEGRMTQAAINSGPTTTYVYNALGQRVEKKIGSAYTEIVYDGYGYVTAFHDRTFWSQVFIPSVGGRQIMKYQDTVTYFLHTNVLGSSGTITNQAGDVTQDALYYPWGQRWAYQGTLRDERFASLGQRDAESALDPTLFRMYTSNQGRWLSPDPIGGDISNPQSLNRYGYVLNNPTNLIDPLGLCGEADIWDPPNLTGSLPCTSFESTALENPFVFQLFFGLVSGVVGGGSPKGTPPPPAPTWLKPPPAPWDLITPHCSDVIGLTAPDIGEGLPLDETSGYGPRTDPITGEAAIHLGIDFRAPEGSELSILVGGTVERTGSNDRAGNYVVVTTLNSDYFAAHLQVPSTFSAGETLSASDVAGLTGHTGRATAPHLHLGRFVPSAFVNGRLRGANSRVPCVPE